MSDQLGDLMYAKDDDDMWELWETFQKTWCNEPRFLTYFKNEWIHRPGYAPIYPLLYYARHFIYFPYQDVEHFNKGLLE